MSAIVTNQGAVFVTQTSRRSAALAGAYLDETVTNFAGDLPPSLVFAVDLTFFQVLAGDLAPSTVFGGDLTFFQAAAGDLSPAVTLAGDITVSGVASYVDFVGDLTPSLVFGGLLSGGSKYGKGVYGVGHYSLEGIWNQVGDLSPVVTFSATLDVVGQQFFAGDLAPSVALGGVLGRLIEGSGGDLPITIGFAADMTLITTFAGDLAPAISLLSSAAVDHPLQGNLSFTVTLSAAMIAGPLWQPDAPSTATWSPTTPCPPSLWAPEDEPEPVDWAEGELCNG